MLINGAGSKAATDGTFVALSDSQTQNELIADVSDEPHFIKIN